ncbi:MAG: hypothetical protein QF662_04085, partial [Phycisphaerae bacterium]|nr:hypothetical protein [Phycisphaerae bacterium]
MVVRKVLPLLLMAPVLFSMLSPVSAAPQDEDAQDKIAALLAAVRQADVNKISDLTEALGPAMEFALDGLAEIIEDPTTSIRANICASQAASRVRGEKADKLMVKALL